MHTRLHKNEKTASLESGADSALNSVSFGMTQFKDNRQESGRLSDLQAQASASIQRKENQTGMPNQLKAGVEHLSGMDMSDVRVHYNSSKPAQFQALAYAQGNQIHLGPGQERHLPHEAWHVVQQKQGRVRPTKQLKGVTNVNDDPVLEKEADVMGAKALQARFQLYDAREMKEAKHDQFQFKTHYVDDFPVQKRDDAVNMNGVMVWNAGDLIQRRSTNDLVQFYRSPAGLQAIINTRDGSLVTQFSFGSALMGVFTHPATYLFIESITTLTAGMMLIGAGSMEGWAVFAVGTAKFWRAMETLAMESTTSEQRKAEYKQHMNKLRATEAALAILLAAAGSGNSKLNIVTKITAGIFAFLKSVRSFLAFQDWGICGKLMLHAIQILEGVTLIIGGNNWESPDTSTLGKVSGAVIGGAKITRGLTSSGNDVAKERSTQVVTSEV